MTKDGWTDRVIRGFKCASAVNSLSDPNPPGGARGFARSVSIKDVSPSPALTPHPCSNCDSSSGPSGSLVCYEISLPPRAITTHHFQPIWCPKELTIPDGFDNPSPSPNLLPCPCCGSNALEVSTPDTEWVECSVCDLTSRVVDLHTGLAVKAWNKRITLTKEETMFSWIKKLENRIEKLEKETFDKKPGMAPTTWELKPIPTPKSDPPSP